MSLEAAIQALTAAVEANTAALQSAGVAAPASSNPPATPAPAEEKTAKRGRPAKEEAAAAPAAAPAPAPAAAPSRTRDEMNAAREKVKEKLGLEEAKKVISEVGKAAKRAEIADNLIVTVFDHCEQLLNGGADEDM